MRRRAGLGPSLSALVPSQPPAADDRAAMVADLQIWEHQVGPLHLGGDDPGHHQPHAWLFGWQFGAGAVADRHQRHGQVDDQLLGDRLLREPGHPAGRRDRRHDVLAFQHVDPVRGEVHER